MRTAGVRLLVVVGKGGVGRSTVAAALAVRAAIEADATRRRVLLVDATADGGAARALGIAASPPKGVATDIDLADLAYLADLADLADLDGPADGDSGATPNGEVAPHLTLLELGTEASLDEYVRLNLNVPIAPRSLGPIARILDFVATAAPAVREILTIGKIGYEVRTGPWDLVVVDAPATGHVVELLAAPRSLGELVGAGPLAAETSWMSELLGDRSVSSAVAVTLAEELPRSETAELLDRLAAETDVAVGGLIVNRVPPLLTDEGRAEANALLADEDGRPLAPLVSIAVDRDRIATDELAKLDALGLPTVLVAEDLADPLGAVAAALAAEPETTP